MIHVPDHIGSVMGKRRVHGELHVFWLIFRPEQEIAANCAAGAWAANPALPFNWEDACTFSGHIIKEVERANLSRRNEHVGTDAQGGSEAIHRARHHDHGGRDQGA